MMEEVVIFFEVGCRLSHNQKKVGDKPTRKITQKP
ncbi:hypothetical protein NIES298_30920 [Microcystis aeruginosa NIES-298]|nr:hypothetical protein NIES298_30920 [Microcystis aeruginosa NIES-298]